MKKDEQQLEYVKCKQSIVGHIGRNRLQPGTLLPSQRELCQKFGLSMITVRRALQELAKDGIVRAKAGKGVFVERDLCYSLDCGLILLLDLDARERILSPGEMLLLGKEINQLGYRFEMLACGGRPTPFANEKITDSTGIMVTGNISEAWKTLLSNLTVPVVIVDNNNGHIPGLKTVYIEPSESVNLAIDHLFLQGCRRFGFLNALPSYVWSDILTSAFNSSLQRHGLDPSPNPIAFIGTPDRYDRVLEFLNAHAGKIDTLLIEAGIFPFVLQAYYANPGLPRLTLAVIGSSSRSVFAGAPEIIQFGSHHSLFQTALDVLLDSFNKRELRYYKDDTVKVETVFLN